MFSLRCISFLCIFLAMAEGTSGADLTAEELLNLNSAATGAARSLYAEINVLKTASLAEKLEGPELVYHYRFATEGTKMRETVWKPAKAGESTSSCDVLEDGETRHVINNWLEEHPEKITPAKAKGDTRKRVDTKLPYP